MTISSTESRVSYAGNGSTTAFSFPYFFEANADLVVIIRNETTGVETTKTITTHYTVTGAGVTSGGTVTMVTAPASGESLIIYRNPTATQTLDLAENDSLPAESLEDALDKSVTLVQRLQDRMDRAVQLTSAFADTFDTTLPALLPAGSYIRVNDTADGFVVGDSASDSTSAAAASAAIAAAAAGALTFPNVTYKVFADSPITLTNSDNGAFLAVDCSSGAVSITLPVISAIIATYPWVIGIKKTDSSANAVTISRQGSDTIDGATSKTLNFQNDACLLMPDTAQAPDDWTSVDFRANKQPIVSKTTGYTATQNDSAILGDATSGSVTITLPAAASSKGKLYYIKKTDSSSNTVVIDGNASETIDGATTQTLKAQYQAMTIICDGSNWVILSREGAPPTFQTFTSGSGTYTTPAGAKWLRVRMAGGGGGGGSGSGGGAGGNGGNTTFGSSLLTANGGLAGATGAGAGGAGGSATVSAPAIGFGFAGGYGGGGMTCDGGGDFKGGGHGGQNAFGGGGGATQGNSASGSPAVTNSGGGGAGGGTASVASDTSGSGGGAGGYIDAILVNPSATYAYAVGAAGAASTGGNVGGAGAAGIIIVEEHYSN